MFYKLDRQNIIFMLSASCCLLVLAIYKELLNTKPYYEIRLSIISLHPILHHQWKDHKHSSHQMEIYAHHSYWHPYPGRKTQTVKYQSAFCIFWHNFVEHLWGKIVWRKILKSRNLVEHLHQSIFVQISTFQQNHLPMFLMVLSLDMILYAKYPELCYHKCYWILIINLDS